MAKVKNNENSIILDEGYKEFNINGDPNRIVRFNPSDFSIIERANKARKAITESLKDFKNIKDEDIDEASEAIEKVNAVIKENINYIFNSDIYDVVFGNQSPVSFVGGLTLVERFLNAALSIIEKAVGEEQKKSQEKISKYTSRYHK